MDPRNPKLQCGDTVNHFIIKKIEPVESLKIIFYELEHETTGSSMVHLSSEDDNNVFMVTFATHPDDDTGVAHILEHGVLEGSKNYPVKIFKNLSGRSLNTFLNAMTSSDYTAYPFASRNKVDFFNLMDLYMDAVFFPLMNKETFLQEGWRYEFAQPDNPSSPLEFKGVVFNEMKGAMGNPVRLFHEYFRKAIFPDLTYAMASGGDPKAIPELTYENWIAFHGKYYHPSNAFFYTYGNISLEELTLKIHNKVLADCKKAPKTKPVPLQKSYDAPKNIRYTYPMSQSENPEKKAFAAVIWKLIPVTEFYENLKLSLVDTILSGSSSSILSRTLLESGLGSGLAPVGFDTSFSESVFGAGLKDVNENDVDKIEKLIISTLEKVAEEGFEESEINAAIHEMEFSSREIKGDHGVPFGLSLAFRGLKIFLEGGPFEQGLQVDHYLEKLREDALVPGFFKSMIKKHLLDNPHRVTMVLAPEPGGMEQQEIDRRTRLDNVRNSFTPEQEKQIFLQAKALLEDQNKEEDTSCLPQIKRDEIDREPDSIPQSIDKLTDIPVYKHPIPTNGINYLTLGFSSNITDKIPLQGMKSVGILTELGAGSKDYIEMGRLIRERTGGISFGASMDRNQKTGDYRMDLMVSSRCLPRNQSAMLDLITDFMKAPDLKNTNRINEILNLQKSYAVPMASFSGHRMAVYASSRWFCPMSWISHNISGLEGIRSLLKLTPDDMEKVAGSIRDFLAGICNRNNLTINLTGDDNLNSDLLNKLSTLTSTLPGDVTGFKEMEPIVLDKSPEAEAWVLSTDVSYVSKTYPAVPTEHPDAPVLHVLSALMETPMYELIRAQGGAYGAFSQYNSKSGLFSMMTYRDPHTVQSIEAFDKVINKLANGDFTDEKLDHAVINVISHLDRPPSPREKGLIAYMRQLNGSTEDYRRKFREGILKTTRDEIVRVVNTYLKDCDKTALAIVTSDKTLMNEETQSMKFARKSIED